MAGLFQRHHLRGRNQQPRAFSLVWSRPIAIAVNEGHGRRDLPIIIAGLAPGSSSGQHLACGPLVSGAAGDVIEWTNKDFVAHTATADDKSFDTGKVDTGQSKRVTVRKAGTFGYFCRYHAGMRGTVTAR